MSKRNKKTKKKFFVLLCLIGGLIAVWLAVGLFLFFNKSQGLASIYVFPENPRQGDTVFVQVKSQADNVTGNFNGEKMVFYKRSLPAQAGNSYAWIAFLGVDADQKPGDYEISVDTSKSEKLTKKIKVATADFSSARAVAASSLKQNGITQAKALSNIIKNDNPAIKTILSDFTSQPYFTTSFVYPLSSMKKSGFSFGKFIEFGKYELQHFGVDLKASEKTDIYAVNDGKVVATLDLSNYGKTVIIDHGLDIFSMYLHLDEFKVSTGQIVKRGQIIGLSGNTGYVTAPHLHFSMRVDGARVDPIAFIEATKKMDGNSFLADISNAILNIFNWNTN